MRKLIIIPLIFISVLLHGQMIIKPSSFYKQTVVAASAVLEALNFTNVYNFIEGPTGTWTGAAAWDGGYGVATKSLTGDGWIETEVPSTADYYFGIGLSFNNTLNVWPWDFTFFIVSGLYTERNVAGVINQGTAANVGDKIRIKRTGSTITAEYYRSGSWTSLYTYTETSSATLYLKAQSAWDGYVVNPKGYNIH